MIPRPLDRLFRFALISPEECPYSVFAMTHGIVILDVMRMKPDEFSNIFSPLLIFLYEGSFYSD